MEKQQFLRSEKKWKKELLFKQFLEKKECLNNLNLIGSVFHLELIKNQLLQAQLPTT